MGLCFQDTQKAGRKQSLIFEPQPLKPSHTLQGEITPAAATGSTGAATTGAVTTGATTTGGGAATCCLGQGSGFEQGTCLVAPDAASQAAPPFAAGVVTVNTEVLEPVLSHLASQTPVSAQEPTQFTDGLGHGVGFEQGTSLVAPEAASQAAPPLAAGVKTVNREVLVPVLSQAALHSPTSAQDPAQLTGGLGHGVGFTQGTSLVAPEAASHAAPPFAAGVMTVNREVFVPALSQAALHSPTSAQEPTQLMGAALGHRVGFEQGTSLVAPAAASQGAPPFSACVMISKTEVLVPGASHAALQTPVSTQRPTHAIGGRSVAGATTGVTAGTCSKQSHEQAAQKAGQAGGGGVWNSPSRAMFTACGRTCCLATGQAITRSTFTVKHPRQQQTMQWTVCTQASATHLRDWLHHEFRLHWSRSHHRRRLLHSWLLHQNLRCNNCCRRRDGHGRCDFHSWRNQG